MVNRDFEKYINEIESHDFFLNYSGEQLTRLLGRVIIHHYPKNQVIFFQEDYQQYGYYLLNGLIKLEKK